MMSNLRFDWRWIGLVVVIALVAGSAQIPWPLLVLGLGGAGGYLLYLGWQIWGGTGGPGSSTNRVTYWRGERIELPSERRRSNLPALSAIRPALPYVVAGSVLTLGALAVLLRHMGL